jgi:hypothetical protein
MVKTNMEKKVSYITQITNNVSLFLGPHFAKKKNNPEIPNKSGQVTIFIILAIIIVSAVLVYFLWAKPTYFDDRTKSLNFESCVEDAVKQSVSELEKKAGLISPKFTYMYNGEEFTYLCYTNEFYQTCSIQVPFLKKNFEEQLKVSVQENIDTCYKNSIENLISEGYEVTSGQVDYNILIEPNMIRVEIEAPTVIGSQSLARFNIAINSPVYEMTMIATSILQSEAGYGDTDVDSIMLLYPNYIITKIKRGDSTTVYVLENKISKNKFQFASRSLAWPSGYDV